MSNPISKITLCKVTFTPNNQIDFTSISAQSAYFQTKVKHVYEKCRYQARTSTIKVKGYVDSLQDCNYGFYTNSYNGVSKTFYFWIVAKDYKAREVCELTIQIDVFQTWLFDFNFTPCMVEREHVVNDDIGKNTIPEDFELGDYVTYIRRPVTSLQGDPCFFVGVTDSESGTLGGIFGKTYSGFIIKYYDYNHIYMLNDYITELCNSGKGDSIAFIFSFPNTLFTGTYPELTTSGIAIGGIQGLTTANENINWGDMTFSGAQREFSFKNDTYTPYNNKLYTYPFNFITVKNSSGGNVVLKLENFDDMSNIDFLIESVVTQHPTITITPKNYCGKDFAIDDSISMNDYGLCSWNNDNFANWFAQHQNSINAQSANATSSASAKRLVNSNNYNNSLDNNNTKMEKGVISTALSTISALASFNLMGAAANAIGGAGNTYLDYQQGGRNAENDLANSSLMNGVNYENSIRTIVASVNDAMVQPNTCKGSTASSGLDMARNTATFFIERVGIKPEYARIVDMYFQMFGYQVNKVKQPSFKTRERWNYLKTVNCSVYGDIPNEDVISINNMFNTGLTIWHSEQYMYNYGTDNLVMEVI